VRVPRLTWSTILNLTTRRNRYYTTLLTPQRGRHLNSAHSTMREQYLREFKFQSRTLKIDFFYLTYLPDFLLYVNETWYGSFLYIADNMHAIYITSVVFPCMVGLKTPIDAQSNITILTVVHSLSSLVMLAADNTPSRWLTFLLCGRYSSWKMTFR
jgi:hypothetical protein